MVAMVGIRSTFAVFPLPAYASVLPLLPLYASDATRLDRHIFNIAVTLLKGLHGWKHSFAFPNTLFQQLGALETPGEEA